MADVVERLRTAAGTIGPLAAGRMRSEIMTAIPEIEALRARLSQAGAGGGVVKPLEWRKYRNGDEEAVTPFGTIYTAYASGYWRTNKAPKFIAAGKDVASAKAGAQASWDDEVRKLVDLAALAPSPSAGQPVAWQFRTLTSDRVSRSMWVGAGMLTREAAEKIAATGTYSEDGRTWEAEVRALYTTPPATPVPTASVEAVAELDADRRYPWLMGAVHPHVHDHTQARAISHSVLKALNHAASLTPAPTQGDGG